MRFENIPCWNWSNSVFLVWMGWNLPSPAIAKLQGTDIGRLTRELREHGIRVQGSTIHWARAPHSGDIVEEIESAVGYQTDFHQFMLYTPTPGTPLHREMADQGRLLTDVDFADMHGNTSLTSATANFPRRFKEVPRLAFGRDFERNGPSLYRMCQTMLQAGNATRTARSARP